MKKDNDLSPELMKLAREHEEWIRGVIGHEIKWLLLRCLIDVVNLLFLAVVAACMTLISMATALVLVDKTNVGWLGMLVIITGVVVMTRVAWGYSRSKLRLILFDAKTPLLIDKVDKKTESQKNESKNG